MNILYEDASIVVLDKPAGLSSEEGVPAALRPRTPLWGWCTGWTPVFPA